MMSGLLLTPCSDSMILSSLPACYPTSPLRPRYLPCPSRLLCLSLTSCVLLLCSCSKNSPGAGSKSPKRPAPNGQSANETAEKTILANVKPFTVAIRASDIDPKSFDSADLKILFVGNSHTRTSPEQLGQLFSILDPEKKVLIARAAGGFLAEHAESKHTLEMLHFGDWDYVILQAQKYSTSGKYEYPTEAAITLANDAKSRNSKVIMFPEWSRKGHPAEYLRINKIHDQIAAQTGAEVAPIGQAWTEVTKQSPNLNLFAHDGNHASEIGNYINACVFYMMTNDQKPAIIPAENTVGRPEKSVTYDLENSIATVVKNVVTTE